MKQAKYFSLVVFTFFSFSIFAQSESDNYDPANFIENQTIKKDLSTESENSEVKDINNEENSKLSYQVEIGSSVTSSAFGTSMNFYTAPQINYNFTPKLQFSAGVFIINSTIPTRYFNENASSTGTTNLTRSYFMNKISYQASEKLRISGEILYGMNKNPYSISPNSNKSEYLINFDAEYKINENFKIGIKLSGSNLNSPYGYSNSFGPINSYYNSPFIDF